MKKSEISSALILAAGFGKRLRPITTTTPKCLVKVRGREMLDRAIERIADNVSNIYINTHYLHDKVRAFISKHPLNHKLHAEHEIDMLGTGGTVKKIAELYSIETLLVHNADAYFSTNEFLSEFIEGYQDEDLYLALYPKARLEFQEQGDFDVKDGNVILHKGGEYVYTGLAILNTKTFAKYDDAKFTFVDLIQGVESLKIGCYILPQSVTWLDIGTPEKLASL